MASVFAQGRYVGAILHRGPKGFEAVGEDNASHGCFPSQKEAAAAHQLRRKRPKGGKRSLRDISAELAARGHLNERGVPFSAASINSMLS